MGLAAGAKLGPYEILAPIGAGGMGHVYKARDTRLGRVVAIKVSDEKFTARFEHEARAVAALNHPNICTLYDVGPNYLVMEFVDGTPIASNNFPVLLDLAIQTVDGVAAAHALRLVHRDLKPANILVTQQQRVKILDFGLAIAAPRLIDDSASTVIMGVTSPGTIVGTVSYMSPEQARGQPVDARSDLWSLGVVLYEITTGHRPFEGPTTAVTFAEILNQTPIPVRRRNPVVPPEWEDKRPICCQLSSRLATNRDRSLMAGLLGSPLTKHKHRRGTIRQLRSMQGRAVSDCKRTEYLRCRTATGVIE